MQGNIRVANLIGIVKKNLELSSDFQLVPCYNGHHGADSVSGIGEPLGSSSNSLLRDVFLPTPPTKDGRTPKFSVLSASEYNPNDIPPQNNMEICYSGVEQHESHSSKKTSNPFTDSVNIIDSDSDTPIGLGSIMDYETSPETMNSSNTCMAIVPVDSPHPSDQETKQTTLTESPIKFAGLLNSGMTCYMNSLLQTLYMTPEFRNALYAWRFEGTSAEAATIIPYQLQRLFVELYCTKSPAISTTGLTTSFGWRSSDVVQQQDIHELCRIMFDALEKKLGTNAPQQGGDKSQNRRTKTTTAEGDGRCSSRRRRLSRQSLHNHQATSPSHDLINRLYQGLRSDCVRCTVCNRVSCRPDTFLDIQVPMTPFELNAKPYGSLEAAFRALVKPERLEGSNQYHCSRCETKRDAERVCAFHRMPYLLTLQLMRFTFDMTTLNRIKINDRFTFPFDRWDLSEFVTPLPQDDTGSDDGSEVEEEEEEENLADTVDETSAVEDGALGSGEIVDSTDMDFELISETQLSDNNNLHTTTVRSMDEDSEETDVTNGADSGVNSSTTDSPEDAGFSGSPTTAGSPHTTDEFDDTTSSGSHNNIPTLTAALPSGLALERAVAVAVAKHPELVQHDESFRAVASATETDEDDDGFGTGDTRSACSSVNGASTTRRARQAKRPSRPATAAFSTAEPRRHRGMAGRQSPNIERTPTKNERNISPSAPSSVYELFAIMVHSGYINSDHYYAYIRSFTDGQWYCFNDKSVTRATQSELEETFGSSSSSYSSRANAYFLMYRRVDPELNQVFLLPKQFPPHIQAMMEEIEREEADAVRKRKLEMSICKFEAYTRSPTTNLIIQNIVSLYDYQTMTEAADTVRQILLPDHADLTAPACRLVQYSAVTESFGKSADFTLWHLPTAGPMNQLALSGDDTNETVSDMSPTSPTIQTTEPKPMRSGANDLITVGQFAEQKRLYPFKLWLQHGLQVPGSVAHLLPLPSTPISSASPTWRPYEQKGITVHVSRVDVDGRKVYPVERLWFPSESNTLDLAREVWQLYTNQPYSPTSQPNLMDPHGTCYSSFILDSSAMQLIAHRHTKDASTNSAPPPPLPGLPEWASWIPSDSTITLSSVFPTNEVDCSSSYNYNRSSETAHLYVDLGPYCDSLTTNNVATTNVPTSPLSVPQPKSTEAKRGRWQVGGCGVDTASAGVDMVSVACRVRRLASVVDEHLFCLSLSVELPTECELTTLLLQRQLFVRSSSETPMTGMDGGDSSPDIHEDSDMVIVERGQAEQTEPSNSNSWSDWLTNKKSSFIGPLTNYNFRSGSSNSTESGGSLTAHHGSPQSQPRSSPPHCDTTSVVVSSPSALIKANTPLSAQRRSNSQSDLHRGHKPQTSSTYSLLDYEGCHTAAATMSVSNDQLSHRRVSADGAFGDVIPRAAILKTPPSIAASDVVVDCCSSCVTLSRGGTCRLCVFQACEADCTQKSPTRTTTINVCLDKRLTVDQFKIHLADYLKLCPSDVKIQVYAQHHWLQHDFTELQADSSIRIYIDSHLDPGMHKLDLSVLDLAGVQSSSTPTDPDSNPSIQSSLSPLWKSRLPILCRSDWSVDRIIVSVASMLQSVYHLDVPQSCLRLRKCGLHDPTPGPVLRPDDLLSSFHNPHQGLMVQLMKPSPESSLPPPPRPLLSTEPSSSSQTSADFGFIFVRRWFPAQWSFDSAGWFELSLPVASSVTGGGRQGRWNALITWLTEHTQLPVEQILIARDTNTPPSPTPFCTPAPLMQFINQWNFPGVTDRNQMEPSASWYSSSVVWQPCAEYNALASPVPNNGQIIYFKDAKEVAKQIPNVELAAESNENPMQSCNSIPDCGSALPRITAYQSDAPAISGNSGTRPGSGLHTSSSHGNMFSMANKTTTSDYDRPLRIYTAEDAWVPGKQDSLPPSVPPTSLSVKPRESRTP